MNYSHYMTYPHHRKEGAFAAFILDVQAIVESAPAGSELCGPDGFGEPLINNTVLIIGSKTNGSPFSKLHLSIKEAWPAHRYPILTVRTDKHAYDCVICACLLAFQHHFPASSITTDGTSEDWAPAIALYEYATERQAPAIDFQNE